MINTLLALSAVGFANSIYLTIKHHSHSAINCSILEECSAVTTSSYSTILDIPVAVLGVAFYALVFAIIFLFIKTGHRKYLLLLLVISGIGFLMSVWFIYVQIFILEALCFYCFISAGISTTLFILSIILMRIDKS